MKDDERWQRIWELFHASLELEPSARTAYLENVCAGDDELRRELEGLLGSHDSAPSLLDALTPSAGEQRPDPLVGRRVGPYRVDAVIGEGGMGVVYAATQEEPIHRQVALKLIREGMDSAEVVARFESERQALALMGHPSIARVHDAGSTVDGRPYFVMERVDGAPVTDYCDAHRLSTTARVELFLPICAAVQHAHQKGIVHRDLKPSNLLITDAHDTQPMPKVIDFGIAKAIESQLSERTLQTVRGGLIGTPEYMSPEQAAGLDVDTRTDIYALGVVLYELLTGQLPIDLRKTAGGGWPALERRIREEEPPTPSRRLDTLGDDGRETASRRQCEPGTLRRELDGDLDWIVMKAMAKQRDERYATASELAADLGRFLNHEPVLAGAPGRLYRARKFVRRHRLGVSLAAGLLLVSTGFGLVTSMLALRLSRSLRSEAAERGRAEEVSSFLVDLFEVSDPFDADGGSITGRELLDQGAERIARLEGQGEIKAALMHTMAEVYLKLGLFESARPLVEGALALRRELLGEEAPATLESLELWGVYFHNRGDLDRAAAIYRDLLETRRRRLGEEHLEVAETMSRLGGALATAKRTDEAESLLQEAVDRLRRQAGVDRRTSMAVESLALALHRKGDYEASERFYREALELRAKLGDRDHVRSAHLLNNLGAMLIDHGRYADAEPVLRQSIELARLHLGDRHPQLSMALGNLGLCRRQQGDYESAERLHRQALELDREIYGEAHAKVALGLNNLGLVLSDQGRFDEAAARFREALDLQRQLVGDEHSNVAFHLNNLATTLHAQGSLEAAEPLYRQALAIRRAALPEGHSQTASSLAGLGRLLTDRGDPSGAEALLREAVAIRRRALAAGDWRIAEVESMLGRALLRQEKLEEAAPLLIASAEVLGDSVAAGARRAREARERLGELYERSGGEPEVEH